MDKLRSYVERLQTTDIINMKSVKEKLRYLKNSAESCRSIPRDFRGQCVCVFERDRERERGMEREQFLNTNI